MSRLNRRTNPFLRWLFLVPLLIGQVSVVSATKDVWTNVERIIVIGDIHGDYEHFFSILRSAGLIDQKRNWSGGKTHLVQTGDVLDRGPDSRKVMDLLMKLEKQARKAGGYVHALIGNHEAMNLYGDLRYVSPGEYAAFQDEDSEWVRQILYEDEVNELKRKKDRPEDSPLLDEEAFRQKWESDYPLGYFEHRFGFDPEGIYGKWIRGHNTVIKINDTLFLHGGISPKYATASIREINETVRQELKDFGKLAGGITLDAEGPLWYRGLAEGDERSLGKHLATVLQNHQVKRMVVGHTPTTGAIMPRFNARALIVDVGISKPYGGRLACLLIETGKVYALHRGKKLAIPSDSSEGILRYLQQAAALDPSPSPLGSTITELEAKLANSTDSK